METCFCKKAAWKSAKAVGKDSVGETGAYIVCRQKDNCVQTESLWNRIFENAYQAVHSHVFPYVTDLHVSSSL